MKPTVTDIDIDVPDRDGVLKLFPHVVANNGKVKHNTGVYFHRAPVNPMNGRCSIDYKEAEDMGYFEDSVLREVKKFLEDPTGWQAQYSEAV